MKPLFFSIFIFFYSLSANAENIGRVQSKGSDCGIIDVESAHLSISGGNKVLIMNVTVDSLAYAKRIWVQHSNGQGAQAVWSDAWWQYAVAAKFVGQANGRETIRLYDQMVGPGNEYTIGIYVTMNGHEYSCSSVRIGE